MPTFQWSPTNAPKKARHDDIWFITPTKGWAINSDGQILKTEDAGATWIEQAQVGPNTWLRCISFVDEKIGWVGSTTRQARLWQTKNGGDSWSKVSNLPPQPTAICGLWIVDHNVIYAAGTNYPDRPTAILKTIDGGNNWVSIPMEQYANLLVDIYFLDAKRGWVIGGIGGSNRADVNPVVLYTEDGGSSWVNQLAGNEAKFPKGEWGWKIHFLDEKIGFISLENFAEGAILRTEDGGKRWVRLPVNDAQKNANLEGIGFLNSSTGWVGGWGDKNFKGGHTSETNNGGILWSDANHIGKFINRFRFTGNNKIVAYASGDTVYRYAEKDLNFQPLSDQFEGTKKQYPELISELSVQFIDHFSISVNVPAGAKRLTVEIWDRFAVYVIELHDELNPVTGLQQIKWDFRDEQGNDIGKGYFVFRVTIDNQTDSRIILRDSESK